MLGTYLGNSGELRAGYEISQISARRTTGVDLLPSIEENIGALVANAFIDRLDDWNFPRRGWYGALELRAADDNIGAERDYLRYQLDLQRALSAGRHAVVLAARYGESTGDGVSIVDAFDLGGFQTLSGAQERQLLGEDVLFGRLAYRYQIRRIEGVVRRLYLGGSAEAGRIQERLNGSGGEDLRFAGSLYVAADTAIGPLYLGGGVAEGGSRAFYLFLGRP